MPDKLPSPPATGITAALVLAVLALAAAGPAAAATPSGGTLAQPGDSLAWSGGPFTSFNASTATCLDSVSCDRFELQLVVPAGKVGVVRARIEWASADDDFDLFVFDDGGAQVDSSTQGSTTFEEIRLAALAPGRYSILTTAWLTQGASYSGTVALEAIADPPGADVPVSDVIRFSDDTLVDFSAVSGEPFIRVDAEDHVYVSVPFGLSTTVSILWKSIDGGRSFIPLGAPIVRDAVTAPGGGDTHQAFDGNGFLYYVDLSGACVTAAVSPDGGNTFPPERTNSLTCVSVDQPMAAQDDRQWVGAFGDGIGYATWRNLVSLQANDFWMFKTRDAGLSWDGGVNLGGVDQSGPFQVDPKWRPVAVDGVELPAILSYQVFFRGTNLRVFRIADFDDGSPPRVDDLSIANPGESVSTVFPVLAIDTAGNLYAAWSQAGREIWMTASTDRGDSWSQPVRVSEGSGSHIMPWLVAGDPGRVALTWYRGTLPGNPAVTENEWSLFFAQTLNAFDESPSFERLQVSQTVLNRGEICTAGLNCDIDTALGTPRDRSFLEFPSIDVDSRGAAVVTFNDNTNQAGAPYVMVAKQVSGPSLYESVGSVDDPGRVTVEAPAAGAAVDTPGLTVRGRHELPPANFDRDEAGDARFPDHGPVIGESIPALDLLAVAMRSDDAALTVEMTVADTTTAALVAAGPRAGGDGVLYLLQWDLRDDVQWVAAEVRAGVPVFLTGGLDSLDSSTSKKYVTYHPDPVGSLQLEGEIVPGTPGTIRIRVPRGLLGGPADGSTLYTATAYAMSERGPLAPVPGGAIGNPTSLPLKVDASGAFHVALGDRPRLAGRVEVALDDPGFGSAMVAEPEEVTAGDGWRLELAPAALTAGSHTLYARQVVDGMAPSPVVAVPFEVLTTIRTDLTDRVALRASNAGYSGGVAAFDLRIENRAGETVFAPLHAEVVKLTSASGDVTVANADNGATGPGATFAYDAKLGADGELTAGETSGAKRLRFNDPGGQPFTVDLAVEGHLARPTGVSSASAASVEDRTAGAPAATGAESTATAAAAADPVQAIVRLTVHPLLGTVTVEVLEL